MNIQHVVNSIQKCGGIANVQYENRQGYSRIFILNMEGVSIGRITLKGSDLCSMKFYKPHDCTDIDVGDIIMIRLSKVIQGGEVITDERLCELWERAKFDCNVDYVKKQNWRRNNPLTSTNGTPRSRRKLTGRNPRRRFIELLSE